VTISNPTQTGNRQRGSAASAAVKRDLKSYLTPEVAIVPVLLVVIIVGYARSAAFLSSDNMFGVAQQVAELGILVMGLTLVLISGKFDLSLESIFGVAPMIAAYFFLDLSAHAGFVDSPVLAFLMVFVIGGLIGCFNGFLVIYLKFNAFIATLATLILLRGVSLGINKGDTLAGLPDIMTAPGQKAVAGIPLSFIIMLVVLLGLSVFLSRHRAGRMIYAVGGNPQAARVAGVRVERLVFMVFVAAGVLAALAGLLQAGRIASVPASLGDGLIFDAFAAAVLGGVSLNGGRGNMLGALGGVLLLVLIQNVLILSQVPGYWIQATTGGIILVALLISKFTGADKGA
jgi:simple sugar transport system permease protein